jgi:hypothetical protein
MNKHILTVIDHQLNPDKYTKEQLKDNSDAAANTAATAAIDAAVWAAAAVAWAAWADAVNSHVDRYFRLSGENKQDYIDAINKDNK